MRGTPVEEMPRRLGLRVNVSSLGAGYVIRQILVFMAITYVAHRIGPRGFGWINLSGALVSYFALLGTLGIPTWGSRAIARAAGPEASRTALRMGFTALLALSGGAAVLALVAAPLLVHGDPMGVLYDLWVVNMVLGALDFQWAFTGMERLLVPAVAQVAAGAIQLIAVRLAVSGPGDIVWGVLGAVLGSAVVAAVEIPPLVRRFGLGFVRPGSGVTRRMIRSTLPLALAPVVLVLYYNMDSVVLGYMRDAKAVGLFNAAYKVVLFLNGIVFVYVQGIYPVLTRLVGEDMVRFRAFLKGALSLTGAAFLPIGVGGVIVASQIVGWVYGRAYLPASFTFQILVWSSVLYAVEVHYAYALLALDRERTYLTGVVAGGAVNLGACLVLVPAMGTAGAALATVVAEGVVVLYMVARLKGSAGVIGPGWPMVARVAVATALMAGAAQALSTRLPLAFTLLLSAVFYALVASLVGAIPIRRLRRGLTAA